MNALLSGDYRLKIGTWTVVREPEQRSRRKLDSPEAVVEPARDLIHDFDDDKEHFWLILLNAQNHYLLAHLVLTGTQSSTLVHPRVVLEPALREGASSLILSHNHPPGDPTPSRQDTRLTIIGNGAHVWMALTTRGALFIVDLLILAKTFHRTRFAPAGPGRGFLESADR